MRSPRLRPTAILNLSPSHARLASCVTQRNTPIRPQPVDPECREAEVDQSKPDHGAAVGQVVHMRYQLPADVTCTRCIMQMVYCEWFGLQLWLSLQLRVDNVVVTVEGRKSPVATTTCGNGYRYSLYALIEQSQR